MTEYPLVVGEKVHIMTRRNFPEDLRRHFVGEVLAATDDLARVTGYAFVHHPGRSEFERRPELRTRLFRLGDANHIVNVMPPDTAVDQLRYTTVDNRLVLVDGAGYTLDINEFGPYA